MCLGRPATIVGTSGNDVLKATDPQDVIFGGGGRDTISGLGMSLFLCGGRGADRIYAFKPGAPDRADVGNDALIKGGRGNDKLYGDGSNSQMWPGPGNDLMDNGSPISEHDATAYYSLGHYGGTAARGPIVADVGRLICNTSTPPPYCTRKGTVTSIDGTDTLINMQGIVGSPYDDLISIGSMRSVGGGDGNDTIVIRPTGSTEFFGAGNGNDTIINNSRIPCGDFAMYGEAGNDTFYGSAGPSLHGDFRAGGCFNGGDGNDTYYGNVQSDYFDGGAGDDTFFGRGNADTAIGGDGADVLNGNRGPDTLVANDGVSGNDTANGGRGTDSCTVDPGDILTNCES
jgi:Ca2+-binding RTX toxin-like protein